MGFHEASPASAMRLIQVIFKVHSMIEVNHFQGTAFLFRDNHFSLNFWGFAFRDNLTIILSMVSMSGSEIVERDRKSVV